MPPPKIETNRLHLRSFSLDDAHDVKQLAGERDIAAFVLPIPHPYELPMAEEWIGQQEERYQRGEEVTYAITLTSGPLIGSISLRVNREHEHAELGYWIGKPYWGHGYATEAAKACIQYGFLVLNLNRIYARHMKRNSGSGRVMEKVGMKYEGCLRQHIKKWGKFEDIVVYSILKNECPSNG
jgi:RimJ/RimL family protein N-acetyltransferase